MCLLFCKKVPKLLFKLLIFPNTLCLSIKITTLVELSPLNKCLLHEFLPLSYLLNIKYFKTTNLYTFDQRSVYPKPVAFLPVPLLEPTSFLKIVFTYQNVCPLQVLPAGCKFSSQCFAQSI